MSSTFLVLLLLAALLARGHRLFGRGGFFLCFFSFFGFFSFCGFGCGAGFGGHGFYGFYRFGSFGTTLGFAGCRRGAEGRSAGFYRFGGFGTTLGFAGCGRGAGGRSAGFYSFGGFGGFGTSLGFAGRRRGTSILAGNSRFFAAGRFFGRSSIGGEQGIGGGLEFSWRLAQTCSLGGRFFGGGLGRCGGLYGLGSGFRHGSFHAGAARADRCKNLFAHRERKQVLRACSMSFHGAFCPPKAVAARRKAQPRWWRGEHLQRGRCCLWGATGRTFGVQSLRRWAQWLLARAQVARQKCPARRCCCRSCPTGYCTAAGVLPSLKRQYWPRAVRWFR